MKKTLLGLLLSTSLLAVGAVSVSADQNNDVPGNGYDTVNGSGTGNIEINGTLGTDNTDPDNPNIPDGNDSWINITFPTTTTFFTPLNSKTIDSPTYTVTNKSGRPVQVSYQGIELPETAPSTDVTLNLKTLDVKKGNVNSGVINLVNGNSQGTTTTTGTVIANLDQVGAKSPANTDGGSFDYKYSGSIADAVSAPTTVEYKMTLQFKALPNSETTTLPTAP